MDNKSFQERGDWEKGYQQENNEVRSKGSPTVSSSAHEAPTNALEEGNASIAPTARSSTPIVLSCSHSGRRTEDNGGIYEGIHREKFIQEIQERYNIEEITGRGGLRRIQTLLAEKHGTKRRKNAVNH